MAWYTNDCVAETCVWLGSISLRAEVLLCSKIFFLGLLSDEIRQLHESTGGTRSGQIKALSPGDLSYIAK